MKLGLSLKTMATAMGISSAYLSSIEYGEKRLAEKHIKAALDFLADKASTEQLQSLRTAAEQSKEIVNTSDLTPDARGLVAAFARKLQQGEAPTPAIMKWLNDQKKGE
jgi:transcriptional regulator with XRE-family HTH domain